MFPEIGASEANKGSEVQIDIEVMLKNFERRERAMRSFGWKLKVIVSVVKDEKNSFLFLKFISTCVFSAEAVHDEKELVF